MTEPLQTVKARLRQLVRDRLIQMTPHQLETDSVQICARLRQQAAWQTARSVLFFAPMPAEPNIWPLLEEFLDAGKIVALPRFSRAIGSYLAARIQSLESDLHHGQLGIREPTNACAEFPLIEPDLVLVPGIAFDLQGRRVGWGKGYYDRLLATVRGVKCGVAFDDQIVDAVPVGDLDVRLDMVVTPTRIGKS